MSAPQGEAEDADAPWPVPGAAEGEGPVTLHATCIALPPAPSGLMPPPIPGAAPSPDPRSASGPGPAPAPSPAPAPAPAALILGRSGAGKSTLALELLALGAALVSDDRTTLRRGPQGAVLAACPAPGCAGLIEARGIGLVPVPHLPAARIALIVDLDATEPDRLPPPRRALLLGAGVPRILGAASPGAALRPALAPAILLLLRAGGAPHPV